MESLLSLPIAMPGTEEVLKKCFCFDVRWLLG